MRSCRPFRNPRSLHRSRLTTSRRAHAAACATSPRGAGASSRTSWSGRRLHESGLAFGERGSDVFTIVEGDPLSARIDRAYRHELERGSWKVACETRTSLSATATDFILSTELEVFEGEERVHRLERTVSIPRDGV